MDIICSIPDSILLTAHLRILIIVMGLVLHLIFESHFRLRNLSANTGWNFFTSLKALKIYRGLQLILNKSMIYERPSYK